MTHPTTIALTAARELITDYVQPDARRVLAMIDAALAAPAQMETTADERDHWRDGPYLMDFRNRLIRDFDRLSSEVSRLTAALAEADEKERGTFMTATLYKNECSRLDTEATAREIAAREEEREGCALSVSTVLSGKARQGTTTRD